MPKKQPDSRDDSSADKWHIVGNQSGKKHTAKLPAISGPLVLSRWRWQDNGGSCDRAPAFPRANPGHRSGVLYSGSTTTTCTITTGALQHAHSATSRPTERRAARILPVSSCESSSSCHGSDSSSWKHIESLFPALGPSSVPIAVLSDEWSERQESTKRSWPLSLNGEMLASSSPLRLQDAQSA